MFKHNKNVLPPKPESLYYVFLSQLEKYWLMSERGQPDVNLRSTLEMFQ